MLLGVFVATNLLPHHYMLTEEAIKGQLPVKKTAGHPGHPVT